MSISRMVSMDVARVSEQRSQTARGGPRVRPLAAGPDAAPQLRAGPPMAPVIPGKPATAPAAGSNNDDAAATALDVLARYIPSEVVAIYIFGLSILGSVQTRFADTNVWGILFGLCLVLVLLFVAVNWLVIKRKMQGKTPFPIWATAAALISFAVWAIAIPGNPLTHGDDVLSMLAGFAALVSSHVLLLIEGLFPKA